MLELPSASASASPPNQSTGAAIRHVDRQDAGFQGRLREVLGSQDAQQPAGRNQAEAKRAQPSDTAKGMEEGVPGSGTPEDSTTAKSEAQVNAEALVNAAMNSNQTLLPVAIVGSYFGGIASAPDAEPQLAEAPTPQLTGQKPNADPTHIMDQVPPGQPDMMVADAQILAAANQQRGPAAVAQPAGQAAPAHPALVQSSDPSLGTPEQQAIIATLAAGSGQATATQAGKPIQPAQTAPKASILTPVEAAEAAKSGLPSALLAQSLGAGDAAEEANPILLGEAAEAGLGSVELGGAKNVIAKHVVENESHIIPGQGFGLAIQDGTFPRADAPMQNAAARELPAPPPPVRQLAPVLVSLALGGGNEALTIMLDPGELGRVEVSIGQGKDAGQVRIIAERPETLALLQRDQRELDRALNQAGLGDMARSLSFSLASDQGRQQHQHAAQDGANRFAALTSGQEAERALIPPMPAPPRASTSLIDLAV